MKFFFTQVDCSIDMCMKCKLGMSLYKLTMCFNCSEALDDLECSEPMSKTLPCKLSFYYYIPKYSNRDV